MNKFYESKSFAYDHNHPLRVILTEIELPDDYYIFQSPHEINSFYIYTKDKSKTPQTAVVITLYTEISELSISSINEKHYTSNTIMMQLANPNLIKTLQKTVTKRIKTHQKTAKTSTVEAVSIPPEVLKLSPFHIRHKIAP